MRLRTRNRIALHCDDACPVVALLRPRSGPTQWVASERYALEPWVPATEYVDGYGNLCQRFTLPAGDSLLDVEHEVEVPDQVDVDRGAPQVLASLTP